MKCLVISLVLALVLLQHRLWLSSDGVPEVWRFSAAVDAQQAQNARLAQRNSMLAAEVRDLKQGYAALEERARTDLGMVSANETFYQVVPPKPARSARPMAPAPVAPPVQRTAAAH